MYKLSFMLCNQTSLVLFCASIIFFILSITYIFNFYRTPYLLKQKFVLQEQSNQIQQMYTKINILYQSLFELEEFCEDLIQEISDDNRNQVMLFNKNRIIKTAETIRV